MGKIYTVIKEFPGVKIGESFERCSVNINVLGVCGYRIETITEHELLNGGWVELTYDSGWVIFGEKYRRKDWESGDWFIPIGGGSGLVFCGPQKQKNRETYFAHNKMSTKSEWLLIKEISQCDYIEEEI